jgi:hypothetical protein
MLGSTLRHGGPDQAGPLFLRSQAEVIMACNFFTAALLDGTLAYVLAVIEHASRRIRILGVTLHPTGEWIAQQARNLLMDLGGQAHRVRFMIWDRGSNFTAAFDAVLAGAGIRTVLCSIRDAAHERHRRTLDRRMPPRAPRPDPHLEPGPSAADPAPVPDPAVTLSVYSHVLRKHAAGVGDIFAQAVNASVNRPASQTGNDDQ